ncbi:type VI secretion system-associated protein TagO [Micavibrio aeruginosavorus]|uniref:type VI secretion system-associated protein TagO n=1 Tax=Micavibrio aeruginosavorus TaxID=349221 RepID=UPI003F4AC85B
MTFFRTLTLALCAGCAFGFSGPSYASGTAAATPPAEVEAVPAKPETPIDVANEMARRLRACKDIQLSMTRLRCYDDTLADYNLQSLTLADLGQEIGKWDIINEKSSISGRHNIMLSLKANAPIMTQKEGNVWPTLVMRCRDGQTESYLVFHIDLADKTKTTRPRTAITTRFDAGQPTTVNWDLSLDNLGAFAPDANAMIETALKSERLYTQVTPPTKSMIESTFDLRGLDKAIVPLKKACAQ